MDFLRKGNAAIMIPGLLFGLLGLISSTWAQPDLSGHEPLPRSDSLTTETVYRAALEHAPEQLLTAIREQQGEEYRALSKRWFPGVPRWQMSLFDDAVLDDIGARELEIGVELDLWRPGERGQARTMASAQENRQGAWRDHLRLVVAGQLRSVMAEIEMADAMLEGERRALDEAGRLLETTRTLHRAGAVPEMDVLQAEGLVLQRRRMVVQAEAMLVDAEYEYRVLTGMDVRPDTGFREQRAMMQTVPEEHPWLRYLSSEVAIERAGVNRVRRQAKGSPTMSVGMRRDRGDAFQPYNDALALSFSVPLGGGSAVSTQVRDAESRRVESEVDLINARRELMRQLHEVQHEMEMTEKALAMSAEQLELDRRRHRMARIAFETGETDLLRAISALRTLQSTEQQHQSLSLRQQALVSEYNQIIGVLP
ncbi:MAG: TolC family protein [Pseudomonadota bacterium]